MRRRFSWRFGTAITSGWILSGHRWNGICLGGSRRGCGGGNVTKQEAISLLEGEIIRCRMAPKINGCTMTDEWKRTIEVCEIAIDAITALEERDAKN